MNKRRFYEFTQDDFSLLSAIEEVSKKIMKVYNRVIEEEISGDFSTIDKNLTELRKLKQEESILYNKIDAKENGAEAFLSIVCKNNKLDRKDINNYNNIANFCFNSNNFSYRMKNILSDKMTLAFFRLVTDEVIKNVFHEESGMLNNLVSNIDEANYAMDFSISVDVYNTYLNYLNTEINKSINATIREDLIRAKYNIISSNIILEDTYINDKFTIPDTTYLFNRIVLDFYSFPVSIKKDYCKTMFNYLIENTSNKALLLGDRPYDSNNYKNILASAILIQSLLKVCEVDSFTDTIHHALDRDYKENNIAKFLITDIVQGNAKNDNKVFNMTLFRNVN